MPRGYGDIEVFAHITDGSNDASIGSKNQLIVGGNNLEVTGLGTALNSDLCQSTDVSNYKWVSVQITGTWVGTITFQTSNDNTNWNSSALVSVTSVTSVPLVSTTANGQWSGPIQGRFFRVRMTAYTSGTASGITEFYSMPTSPLAIGGSPNIGTVTTLTSITNQGQIVDNAAFTDGTTRVMMNGYIFDEVAGTGLTENDGAAARVDSKRAQICTIEDATTRGQRASVDATGHLQVDVISGGGGGTQYAEDSAHNSGDSVTMAGVVQKAADGALSGDGDNSLLQVDDNGFLKVNIKAGAGSGGTAMADDAAFTPGTTNFTPSGGQTTVDQVNAGDGGAFLMDVDRHQQIDIQDISKGTQTNAVKVSDNDTTLSVDDGASSITVDQAYHNNLNANANIQIGDADVGAGNPVPISDNAGNISIDDGGNTITVDATNLDIRDLTSASDSVGAIAQGDIAHDSADSGSPIKVGAKAVLFDGTAPPNAAVAEGDRTNAISDEYGRQYVCDVHPNYWSVSADYAAAQTNTAVKAAPGAGLSLYITDYLISNGATAGNITLLDGSGGTVKVEGYFAINGGCVSNQRTPIKLTGNTALCITSTTVTTHSVSITGFTAP